MTTEALIQSVSELFSRKVGTGEPVRTEKVTVTSKKDENSRMKALVWHGKKSVSVDERAKPLVTDAGDVILKVTSTCICGSDLHLYLNAMPGMENGDIMGHEFMGYVEDAGEDVKSVQKGDRVVCSFDIGCGSCYFCNHQLFSCCDSTNPSKEQEALYGHRSSGMFGYTHLTGGWDGGQAEYVRVPFADVNCLKVPSELKDEQVILLSDVLATAWHATELGSVSEGDVVAIWGAGPVGILAAQCCFVRGAERVILIDRQSYRLRLAQEKVKKVEVINFADKKTLDTLKEMLPLGPDVAIECVGFHYTNSLTHSIEMALQLETDPSEVLNEMFTAVRKGGRVSVVGVYAGYANHFNIGAFMEKGLTMRAGQTPVQRYWKKLLELVQKGELDPTIVITHKMALEDAPQAYHLFNEKQDDCIKCVLKPGMTKPTGQDVIHPSTIESQEGTAGDKEKGVEKGDAEEVGGTTKKTGEAGKKDKDPTKGQELSAGSDEGGEGETGEGDAGEVGEVTKKTGGAEKKGKGPTKGQELSADSGEGDEGETGEGEGDAAPVMDEGETGEGEGEAAPVMEASLASQGINAGFIPR